MIIRALEAGDLSALSALASRTYAETFGASMSAADLEAQLRATRSETYFRKAMHEDAILVAAIEGAIAGYVQVSDLRIPVDEATGEDQELFALYVSADRQGQGIGSALMDAALDHPRLRQARRIYLDVWDENARAVRLYTRYGFRPVGRRDFAIGARVLGSDLVMMRQRS